VLPYGGPSWQARRSVVPSPALLTPLLGTPAFEQTPLSSATRSKKVARAAAGLSKGGRFVENLDGGNAMRSERHVAVSDIFCAAWVGIGLGLSLCACSSDSEPETVTPELSAEPSLCDSFYPNQLAAQVLSDLTLDDSFPNTMLDATHFYVVDVEGNSSANRMSTLRRVSKTGGALEDVATLTGGLSTLWNQGDKIYSLNERGLVEIAKDGGATRNIGPSVPTDRTIRSESVALDATSIYYAVSSRLCEEQPDQALESRRFDTGAVTALATLECPRGIAVDDTDIYYAAGPAPGLAHIERLPKAGGAATQLTPDVVFSQYAYASLTVGATHVYFKYSTDPRAVRYQLARVPKAGGDVETLTPPQCLNMEQLRALSDRVVLNGNQGLAAVSLDGEVLNFASGPGTSDFDCQLDETAAYCVRDTTSGGDYDALTRSEF
jgi:hypothetical protein